MKMHSGSHAKVGTPHMKLCSDDHDKVGALHMKCVQMFIQAQNYNGGSTAHKNSYTGMGTLHLFS